MRAIKREVALEDLVDIGMPLGKPDGASAEEVRAVAHETPYGR
jgi:hypothetical protein